MSIDRSGRARSVDEQQVDNERVAATEGWQMVATHADPNRSASRYATRAREAYRRLLADIHGGVLDVLILWEPSRGSRKVSEWVELIEAAEAQHVLIHVTSHGRTYDPASPRDRRSLLEDAVDSEFESGKTSTRMKRSTAASAEAGRPFGDVPFGYKREYALGSRSPVRQVPDEDTAPIVREIVARVLAGEGLYRISVDLNKRGVPTPQMTRDARSGHEGPRGGWNNPKIRRLLLSPTIAGWRVHRGEIHRVAEWEPLVSAADHAAVVAYLTDPTRRTQRGTAPKHLLSGIAECGVCGAWLRRTVNRGHSSYGCAGRSNLNDGHVVRRAAPLEAYVTRYVVDSLSHPMFLEKVAQRRASATGTSKAALAEVRHIQGQIDEYEAAAPRSGVAAASFARVIGDLYDRLEAAKAKVPAIRALPKAVTEAAGPHAARVWDEHADDIVWQRDVVRALVRVKVHRRTTPHGTHAFDYASIDLIDR